MDLPNPTTIHDVMGSIVPMGTVAEGVSKLAAGMKVLIDEALTGVALPADVRAKLDKVFSDLRRNDLTLADALLSGTTHAHARVLNEAQTAQLERDRAAGVVLTDADIQTRLDAGTLTDEQATRLRRERDAGTHPLTDTEIQAKVDAGTITETQASVLRRERANRETTTEKTARLAQEKRDHDTALAARVRVAK